MIIVTVLLEPNHELLKGKSVEEQRASDRGRANVAVKERENKEICFLKTQSREKNEYQMAIYRKPEKRTSHEKSKEKSTSKIGN